MNVSICYASQMLATISYKYDPKNGVDEVDAHENGPATLILGTTPRSLRDHYHRLLGLTRPDTIGSRTPGGVGRGPVGGGGLIGTAAFWNDGPNLPLENPPLLLLLVLGGNMGLDVGSIADIGSGMLSLLPL